MTRASIIEKLDSMPHSLMGQVSDLLDWLMEAYENGQLPDDGTFSPEQKRVLLMLMKDMEARPDEGISLDALKIRMRERHGT